MFYLGLLIFFGVHCLPFLPSQRAIVVTQVGGEWQYRVAFSSVSIVGLVLIAWGYDSSATSALYNTVAGARDNGIWFIFSSWLLVVSSLFPGYIKKRLKHPQAAGMAIWGFYHLSVNADLHSLLLFGSVAIYALASAFVADVTKRPDTRPDNPEWRKDIIAASIAALLTAVSFSFHETIAGVPL